MKIANLKFPNFDYGFIPKAASRPLEDKDWPKFTDEVAYKIGVNSDKLSILRQIHSNKSIYIDKVTNLEFKADGHLTDKENIHLVILTADCVPILLLDPHNKIIGAIHAGWRGARFGVIESTIQEMLNKGAIAKNIIAIIGPAISQKNYEVGDEFLESFLEESSNNQKFFKKLTDKNHFDNISYVKTKLNKLDIHHIFDIGIDTFENHNFYSYRRLTKGIDKEYGSNVSYIVIKND
ncbi:MAG: peptidoglycan editing factor PgeF [Sphingobacteriia bacterium]|nr:peptidoglycan editing factor PgeF [Sphingobacteriia bacterium]